MIVNQKYAPTAPAPDTEKTQFPGVRSAISGHRYYSPTLGRFINKDPIEEQGGLNLYGICSNNGVNRWDYLGNETNSVAQAYIDALIWSQRDGGAMVFRQMMDSARALMQSLAQSQHDADVQNAMDKQQVWYAQNNPQGTNSPSGNQVDVYLPKLVVTAKKGDDLLGAINIAANDLYGHGAVTGGPINTWEFVTPAQNNAAPFTVTVNSRPADIPGGRLLDAVDLDHQWISTSTGVSVGMGTDQGVPQSDAPGVPTFVVDHSGQIPTRTETYTNVDQDALMSYLKPGTPLGSWMPGFNDCNTWRRNVIERSTPHDDVTYTYTPYIGYQSTKNTNVVVYADGSTRKAGDGRK